MILIKGKQYFWSQLLLSVIAIFTLPIAQDLEPQNIASDYPREQRVIQQLYQTAAKIQQVQQQQLLQLRLAIAEPTILFEIAPLFLVQQFNYQAPIRAGPKVS
ncbi:hypothetical protein B0186_06755 [Canicola haemoglobinophilus]|uniref:Protein of uncharacterized function (DUF2547) n=1 Tax=Canicola haemoglobinophilus TaxID=733 RepID=A0A1V4B0N3_9PAST|nr:secA translation cis-regulator SecM [Canicola haemoglobinophilus]OOS00059.1 hypothetical protein B0186_06755 [Canicola haemoglobinophilus]STO53724.1 Protein of uncharacterised function (DUF2547) [Canicola haemoglobinophilus]STO60845.1 Protein of uncharacterised function (DUF2547) [Canicola haemoglobinophilus]STO68257.1 Protein of uncharacterised function (DUF2547) [Canicola haemoglobinophilus]